MIVGFDMRPQSSGIHAREVRLVEINRPLHLAVASYRQFPRQEIPLVTVQVVDREHIGADLVLDSAELAAPHDPPFHPGHYVSCNDVISGHHTHGTLNVDTGKSLAIAASVAEPKLLSRCVHVLRFLEHAKQPSNPIVTTTTTVS
jgi:hypothetical protein